MEHYTLRIKRQKDDIQRIEVIEVTAFFSKITKAYFDFEQDVKSLTDKIPSCTPQQLFDECNLLRGARADMAILDEQMFDIIKLAGGEIAHHPMLREYRIAFARANMACTTLYQKIREVKIALQDTVDVQTSLN